MARRSTASNESGSRRDLFGELMEGVSALKASRRGKRTLRTHAVEFRPAPVLSPDELVRLRERLNLSRGVFAAYLRTNVRTLENWEQGRARPNAQAVLTAQAESMRKDPNYVPQRSLFVIMKDWEQESCVILMIWALAMIGFKYRVAREEQDEAALLALGHGGRQGAERGGGQELAPYSTAHGRIPWRQ